MEQNFKCRSCGLIFQADDSDSDIKCPACSSDNLDIERKSKNSKKIIIIVAIVCFIVATAIGIVIRLADKPDTSSLTAVTTETQPAAMTIGQAEYLQPDPDPVPAIVELMLEYNNDLKPNVSTKSYSFSVYCKNIPEGAQVEYKLYDFGTGKLVATSKDGKFAGVPAASDDSGSYRVEVEVKTANGTDTTSLIVPGFFKFAEKMERLSVSDVQTLVNKMVKESRASYLSSNPGISQNVTLSFTDMRGEEPPTGFSALLSRINMGIWSSLTVTNLGYEDSTNRVNRITFKPNWVEE